VFTNKKGEGINTFVCDVFLYVAETPKASIKDHEPPLPIIPFGIVAYGFVGQPVSEQLYDVISLHGLNCPVKQTVIIWLDQSGCTLYFS